MCKNEGENAERGEKTMDPKTEGLSAAACESAKRH